MRPNGYDRKHRKKMKAIRAHEFGEPDVLQMDDIPVPAPQNDELLIKVVATSINPVDWKILKGGYQSKFPVSLPLTPGWDVSGVVEKTGADVQDFKPDDEVYSRPDPTKNGAFAEYIVVKANIAALKPRSIDHIHAAAVPLAGLTAWQGLFEHGQLQAGQKVLIHAASGGVGTFAVQFAKWKGAYVIGTASDKNLDFVKELGADEVIDYKNEKFEDKLGGIDLVFDTIGGETQKRSLTVLKNGGRLITTLKPEFENEARENNIHLQGYTAQSYPDDLRQIAGLIDEQKIKPVISRVMPLAEAKMAEKLNKDGHTRGKIVLNVAQPA
jgi:NADPH:quinone reductase-like Zn-dependent oxidoreductase